MRALEAGKGFLGKNKQTNGKVFFVNRASRISMKVAAFAEPL